MGAPEVTPAPALLTRSDFFRGPLTSVFIPPSSCFHLTRSQDNPNFFAGHGGDRYFDASCYPAPPSNAKSDLQETKYWTSYYYSPAICPQGYSTVQIFQTNFPGFEKSDGVPLGPSTSAGLCCPSGYSYSAHGHLCSSSITPSQVISYIIPTSTGQSWTPGSLTTSTASAGSIVVGNGIPIWWQKTDEAILAPARVAATAPPPSPTSSTSAKNPTTNPPIQPPPIINTPPSSTNTSKIGIAVGIVVFVVTVLAAVLLFLLYRNKKKAARAKLYGTGRSAGIIDSSSSSDAGYQKYQYYQGDGYDRSTTVSPVPPSYHDAKFDARPANAFAVGELDASVGTRVAPLELPGASVVRG